MPTTPRSRATAGFRTPVVSRRSRVEDEFPNQFDHRIKFGPQFGQQLRQGLELFRVEIKAHAAQARHPAQKTVASQQFIEAQHAFLEPQAVHIRGGKGHIRANRADVADVIVEPLEFEADGAQKSGARRRFQAGGPLHGVTKRGRVRETRIARNAFGQPDAM